MDGLNDAWWRPKGARLRPEFEKLWQRRPGGHGREGPNHPSVVMYSIGNEIAETATAKGIRLNGEIADRTRQLTPLPAWSPTASTVFLT